MFDCHSDIWFNLGLFHRYRCLFALLLNLRSQSFLDSHIVLHIVYILKYGSLFFLGSLVLHWHPLQTWGLILLRQTLRHILRWVYVIVLYYYYLYIAICHIGNLSKPEHFFSQVVTETCSQIGLYNCICIIIIQLQLYAICSTLFKPEYIFLRQF